MPSEYQACFTTEGFPGANAGAVRTIVGRKEIHGVRDGESDLLHDPDKPECAMKKVYNVEKFIYLPRRMNHIG